MDRTANHVGHDDRRRADSLPERLRSDDYGHCLAVVHQPAWRIGDRRHRDYGARHNAKANGSNQRRCIADGRRQFFDRRAGSISGRLVLSSPVAASRDHRTELHARHLRVPSSSQCSAAKRSAVPASGGDRCRAGNHSGIEYGAAGNTRISILVARFRRADRCNRRDSGDAIFAPLSDSATAVGNAAAGAAVHPQRRCRPTVLVRVSKL